MQIPTYGNQFKKPSGEQVVNPLIETEQAEVIGEREPVPIGDIPTAAVDQLTGERKPLPELYQTKLEEQRRRMAVTAPTMAPEAADTSFAAFTGTLALPPEQRLTPDNINSMIENSFADMNNFFSGIDLSALGDAATSYLNQLVTGQTEATRALQSQEAAAMSQGVMNIMNNISATAASAGITGGELQRFYNKGITQISKMMGDFAADNLVRMAETQEKGFEGIMDMFKLQGEQRRQWLDTYMDYKQFTTNENRYLVSLASTDPVAAEIYKKLQSGGEVTQEDLDYIDSHKYDYWTQDDLVADVAFYDEFGMEYNIVPATDSQGNQIVNRAGEPVWKVVPKTNLSFDAAGNPYLTLGTKEVTDVALTPAEIAPGAAAETFGATTLAGDVEEREPMPTPYERSLEKFKETEIPGEPLPGEKTGVPVPTPGLQLPGKAKLPITR